MVGWLIGDGCLNVGLGSCSVIIEFEFLIFEVGCFCFWVGFIVDGFVNVSWVWVCRCVIGFWFVVVGI